MRIRNNFKRGKKVIPQKDIILNHCYRLNLSSDDITHQLYYLGDILINTIWENEVDESIKLKIYSTYERYLENILVDSIQVDEISLKSYGEIHVGYSAFVDDLIIWGYSKDQFVMLIFCKQSRRSKTIFGAFKATQMNKFINPANPLWRLICEF